MFLCLCAGKSTSLIASSTWSLFNVELVASWANITSTRYLVDVSNHCYISMVTYSTDSNTFWFSLTEISTDLMNLWSSLTWVMSSFVTCLNVMGRSHYTSNEVSLNSEHTFVTLLAMRRHGTEFPLGSNACLSTVSFHRTAPSNEVLLVTSIMMTQACAPLQNCGINATRLFSWPQMSQSYDNMELYNYYVLYSTHHVKDCIILCIVWWNSL